MTDATTELTELHALAQEWEGCPWWPECVKYDTEWGMGWVYLSKGHPLDTWVRADPHHALDLVTCEAERWLVGKGWHALHAEGVKRYTNPRWAGYANSVYPLPEALEYAMAQNKGN